MDQSTQNFADHYGIQLSPGWQRWFLMQAQAMPAPPLSGAFQSPLNAQELCVARPQAIWAGLMLPDTLPIIGNEYGDWICARATEDGHLGELIHWYHGGGDWIPVGKTLSEALLHDIVDQFRPLQQQMLRGAAETLLPNHRDFAYQRASQPELLDWFAAELPSTGRGPTAQTLAVREIFEDLFAGRYTRVLSRLVEMDWSYEAAACDLIEANLQQSIAHLAPAIRKLAATGGDHRRAARWMFDLDSADLSSDLADINAASLQNWDYARHMCAEVIERRQDLGWAFDILGWCQQRALDPTAQETYFAGRFSSSFTDQAVRLSSHWFDRRYGKFCIARLADNRERWTDEVRRDPYLQAILDAKPDKLLENVENYWLGEGRDSMRAGQFARAYGCFYRAGWDMGAQRLDHYAQILQLLAEAAAAAGWTARESVAKAHLRCLAGPRH